MTEPLSARILHLQRLSTEDGPGIRTTVFFKGCPLRCEWCHNPESLSPHPQVQWLETRCIGCRTCLDVCPNACLLLTADGMRIDRERCTGCGACAEACPANAMELLGATVTVEDLVKELVKDRTFYETSGGGVTASGGEPAMQAAFVAALLARLKAEGVDTALDTCGLAPPHSWGKILPHVDLVLFDLKQSDPEQHRMQTGQSNDRILEALLEIRNYIAGQQPHPRLWIRTPLIPGATATADNLRGLGALIARHLDGLVERWELCAFNNLCRDKYRRLGMPWRFQDTPLLSSRALRELEHQARQSGVDPAIVVATGPTQEGT